MGPLRAPYRNPIGGGARKVAVTIRGAAAARCPFRVSPPQQRSGLLQPCSAPPVRGVSRENLLGGPFGSGCTSALRVAEKERAPGFPENAAPKKNLRSPRRGLGRPSYSASVPCGGVAAQRGFSFTLLLHQRPLPSDPFVLRWLLRSFPTATADRGQPDSRRSKPSSRNSSIGEQPNPWDLLQPLDELSRHRGAKRSRR